MHEKYKHIRKKNPSSDQWMKLDLRRRRALKENIYQNFDFKSWSTGHTNSRVNVGHTNSHEWEEYTFAAFTKKMGKNTNKIVC